MNENNYVRITGYVDKFIYNHTAYDERFYSSFVHSQRRSGTVDDIPVIASEYLVKKDDLDGKYVEIDGEFRSMNMEVEGKSKLILQLFVKNIRIVKTKESADDENEIVLDGFLVKNPIYRTTPNGRQIADMMIAVNRPLGRSDYIPCICWGKSAKWAENLEVGTEIFVQGRIQSREYVKRLSEDESEIRTAYEVSIGKMRVTKNGNQKES